MQIKTADGSYHVASEGKANTGLGFGIAGTALGLLGGGLGNVLGGVLGGNNVVCAENIPVNRYEMNMALSLNAKDSEIALLKADKYTDEKMVDLTKYVDGKIESLAAEVRSNKDAQNAINMQQAVYNGTNTATIQCLQGQVAQLLSLTKLVVPNTSVCPGWGNVTITPATTTTGGGAA